MSQSKTFSEFLVEQGLITADDLVSILIDQAKQLPTPAELAREHKLLDAKQMLSVFAYQMQTSVEFVKACRDLGLWNENFAHVFSAENSRLRVPVVQLLQKSGKLQTEALVSALDSYLSENSRPNESHREPPRAAAAVESLKQVPAFEDSTMNSEIYADSALGHFREYYTQTIQEKMVSLAKEWDQSNSVATDALLDRVHGIVGAARFAKLSEIEDLFKNAESNVRALADCATPLPQAAIDAFRMELVVAFEKGWSLRESAQEPSESIEVAV